ncbi:MAG: FHA domain-containing protein [Myxococcales bacterium]|nr:FHA domain-containing protein [Myxococcales bacterium]
MALWTELRTGRPLVLRMPHRFGRSRSNHTALEGPEVSGEHAIVRFREGWDLHDLASRNGTFVNGARLPRGARHRLVPGDRVGFGRPEPEWEISSVAPPAPCAIADDDVVEGEGELLALPSLDDPQWVLRHDADAGWVSEAGPVTDGQRVDVAGRSWELRLPEALVPTHTMGLDQVSLESVSLHFVVARNEEQVHVTVQLPHERHRLTPRGHHYVLVTLARLRLQDAAAQAPEQGWREIDALLRMLKMSRNHLYVAIHRNRKEMLKLGIVDGSDIVERERRSSRLRIGLAELSVDSERPAAEGEGPRDL